MQLQQLYMPGSPPRLEPSSSVVPIVGDPREVRRSRGGVETVPLGPGGLPQPGTLAEGPVSPVRGDAGYGALGDGVSSAGDERLL